MAKTSLRVRNFVCLFSMVLLGSSLYVSSVVAQAGNGPLNNKAVVKLVKAGFKEKTIISIIGSRPANFQLDTDQLIELKHNGVSENIILAMLSQSVGLDSPDEDWSSNDSFFKGLKGSSSDPNSQSANIFGSGASSGSSNRSRGREVGDENEGNVTGSATVRIIRPPSEAGGASEPKLEKTPTLDNEAVIQLVEAGFSEGTIIKRIAGSPADFDLTPARLDELHKRRVSDAIITAMTQAMNGDKE
jgi:hypothetical protein